MAWLASAPPFHQRRAGRPERRLERKLLRNKSLILADEEEVLLVLEEADEVLPVLVV